WAARWQLQRTDSGVGDWLLAVLLAAVLGAGGGFIAGFDRRRLYVPAALAAWVLPPLFLVPRIGAWWGLDGLIALLVLSKIGDIAGYFTGNAIGKTHPFPSISPGKTTAGCVGSLVAGTIAGGICVAIGLLPDARLGLLGGLLAGAALNIAAQAGDLAESWVKRRAEAKDSATWFGPAGGVLDLVDSLLFSVPAALLVWPIVFAS
ncbi:MAG: phosphatidate cytidylyltransferase, partial [Planctomycetota bacterium]